MSKGKDLAKNTAIVSIGKICTQLITFLLLPVYSTRMSCGYCTDVFLEKVSVEAGWNLQPFYCFL